MGLIDETNDYGNMHINIESPQARKCKLQESQDAIAIVVYVNAQYLKTPKSGEAVKNAKQ